jgi:hypothetical protein
MSTTKKEINSMSITSAGTTLLHLQPGQVHARDVDADELFDTADLGDTIRIATREGLLQGTVVATSDFMPEKATDPVDCIIAIDRPGARLILLHRFEGYPPEAHLDTDATYQRVLAGLPEGSTPHARDAALNDAYRPIPATSRRRKPA